MSFKGLESDRQQIPDAPCVYLVQPTAEAVRRIARDLQGSLYSELHINFCGCPTDALLEDLALAAVDSGHAELVRSVAARHLDFVALERDLFHLQLDNSYTLFNDPSVADTVAAAFVDTMVEVDSKCCCKIFFDVFNHFLLQGLYSVCCTLQRVPVIRCNPVSNVSVMVAKRLCRRLHDSLDRLRDTRHAGKRLLLVIDDRNTDLTAMLHHCPNYQALVQDILPLENNRVT